MDRRPSIMERAFELARSGECRAIAELRERLAREGYEMPYNYTSGKRVKQQLRAEFAKHKGKPAEAPPS